jgi:hypothetical protein
MDQIAKDFADHGVVFYMLYTREPHAGQKMKEFDFSGKKQTKTHEERVEYAAEMVQGYSQNRPVLIDTFGGESIQKALGGSMPNSLIVIDKEGKVALWQRWSKPDELRKKLEEMTGAKPAQPIEAPKAEEAPAE